MPCTVQDGSEGDSRYLAPEVLNSKGAKRPPADVYSLGMSMFELVWNVRLLGRGDAWSALRRGEFPDVDPALRRSSEMVSLVKRVRVIFDVLTAAAVGCLSCLATLLIPPHL